jgi:hypothetical protein
VDFLLHVRRQAWVELRIAGESRTAFSGAMMKSWESLAFWMQGRSDQDATGGPARVDTSKNPFFLE